MRGKPRGIQYRAHLERYGKPRFLHLLIMEIAGQAGVFIIPRKRENKRPAFFAGRLR
jgi:hypothetical protein